MKIFKYILIIMLASCSMNKSSNPNKLDDINLMNILPQLENLETSENYKSSLTIPYDKIVKKMGDYKSKNITRIISSTDYSSWIQCFKDNKNIKLYLLQAGDYTKWGRLETLPEGTKRDPVIISNYHYNSEKHPYNIRNAPSKEVILSSFSLKNKSNCIINKISFRAKNKVPFKGKVYIGGKGSEVRNAHQNIINQCYFENITTAVAAIRIYNSNNNIIQNCIFEQIDLFPTDNVAILLIAEENISARGNKILNNEIINWNDGVQTLRQNHEGMKVKRTGDFPATRIDNNDIYITEKLYRKRNDEVLACAENGLDIKVGSYSSKLEDLFVIRNNRIWGYRYSDKLCGPSGSGGEGIVIHRVAANILVEKNNIFDCSIGIAVRSGNVQDKDSVHKMERITVKDNLLFGIKKTDKSKKSGIALELSSSIKLLSNIVLDCHTPFEINKLNNNSMFQNNYFLEYENLIWKKYNGDKVVRLKENVLDKEGVLYRKKKMEFSLNIKKMTKQEKINLKGKIKN